MPTVLIVATLDTKFDEVNYLRRRILEQGCNTVVMDCGILGRSPAFSGRPAEISPEEVAAAGGGALRELVRSGDKGRCIETMIGGAGKLSADLYKQGWFQAIISIGGAQGTDIGTAAMRVLPFGVPKLMVSAIANGLATFGSYVGTKDIMIMHSVVDLQGLNMFTKRVLDSAAAAVVGMVKADDSICRDGKGRAAVAMSMLGTTTPGALLAKSLLEKEGLEVVAFHQNGTGGIAMEDMIMEGHFAGVLDINLHEIGDWVGGGLHRAIRPYRLESAGRMGLPQVVAPGSINYTIQGPLETLTVEQKKRQFVVHNPNLTMVRLSLEEMRQTGRLVAEKLNKSAGAIYLFIPLKGFSYPDREGLAHWDPEANRIFIEALKNNLNGEIPVVELDAHINDPEFILPVVERFLSLINNRMEE